MPIIPPNSSKLYTNSQGYRVIAGRRIYFRSSWEVNFALTAQYWKEKNVIKESEYEPKPFWFENIKRGVRSYKPDFKITLPDERHYWVEVKGYMDSKSATKIKRLRKDYPDEKLVVLEKKWFDRFKKDFYFLSKNWENDFTDGELT